MRSKWEESTKDCSHRVGFLKICANVSNEGTERIPIAVKMDFFRREVVDMLVEFGNFDIDEEVEIPDMALTNGVASKTNR